MFHYIAFALHIASDIPLPECLTHPHPTENAIDLTIQAGEVPVTLDGNTEQRCFHGKEGELLLQLEGIANFWVKHGKTIIYHQNPNVDNDSLRLLLLGSCMGAILQQRGLIVLHGNAISLDGKTASIFVGHTGAGKSTTAGKFFKQGAYILADDVCAIIFDEQNRPLVLASYPQIKLWKDSANLLAIPTQNLRRIRPDMEKFAVGIGRQFHPHPLPLTHIIEIQAQEDPQKENKTMHGLEKMKALLDHSYRNYFLPCMKLDKHYGKLLLDLSKKVNINTATRAQIANLNPLL